MITVDDEEPLAKFVPGEQGDSCVPSDEEIECFFPSDVPPDVSEEALPLFRLRDHRRFVDDMLAAGLMLHVFSANSSYLNHTPYYGPAMTTRNRIALQDAIRATKVRVQWHYVGKHGAMLYPAVNDLKLRQSRTRRGPSA